MSQHMRRAIVVTFALALLLIVTAALAAQSGRRAPKTKAAPVPTPAPEAPAPKPTPTPKPVLTLIVGIDHFQGFSYWYVLDSCVDRLDDNRAVKVVVASGDMTAGEAVRRARKETEAYIVRLTVTNDTMTREINDPDLSVEYWVHAPVTAKVATHGRVYTGSYQTGSIILNPRKSRVYGDYRLQEAGRKAAERILSALNHPIPTRPIPSPVD